MRLLFSCETPYHSSVGCQWLYPSYNHVIHPPRNVRADYAGSQRFILWACPSPWTPATSDASATSNGSAPSPKTASRAPSKNSRKKLDVTVAALNRLKADATFLAEWEVLYRKTVGSPEKAQRVVQRLYETAEDRTDPRQVPAAKAYLEAIDAIKPKKVEVTVNKAAKELSDEDLYRILAERAETRTPRAQRCVAATSPTPQRTPGAPTSTCSAASPNSNGADRDRDAAVVLSSHVSFSFNAATTEPIVGNQVRINNASQTAATRLWVSHTTFDGLDVTAGLTRLSCPATASTSRTSTTPPSGCATPSSSNPTNDGTYHDYPVTYAAGPGQRAVPEDRSLQFIFPNGI